MNELLRKESIYNTNYIIKHKLSSKKIKAAGIELIAINEIFVQYPCWKDYYGSNYGRLISLKCGKIEIRTPYEIGRNEKERYLGYKLFKVVRGKQKELSISCHRLVADIFLPNYWRNVDRNKLNAHHLDGHKANNYYKNLVLLPVNLHTMINRVKKIILLSPDNTFKPVTPYQIIEETGLTLEKILLATKEKPIKSQGKYSIFNINGILIGFQFYQKNNKR